MMPVDTVSTLSTAGDAAGRSTYVLNNWLDDSEGTSTLRPALVSYAVTGINAGTTIIGVYRFRDQIIAVGSDRFIYRIPDSASAGAIPLSLSTDATTQLGGTFPPTFAEQPSTIIIAGGGYLSKWTYGDFSASQLTNGPPACTHVATIGQRLVANNIQSPTTRISFWYSSLGEGSINIWNSGASPLWSAGLQYEVADADPDPIVGVATNISTLLVFGSKTLQVFQTGVNPLAPYDPINTITIGCSAPYSLARVDNQFAVFDDRRRFVITDGTQYNVISDSIANELRALSTVNDCIGWRTTIDRWDLLKFAFPTAGQTYVYNLGTKTWRHFTYYTGGVEMMWPVIGYAYREQDSVHVMASNTSTTPLMMLSLTARTDLGNPIAYRRTTGWLNHGTDFRKRSRRLRATVRRGAGAPSPGSLEVRVQDDGNPWTTWEPLGLGAAGDYDHEPEAYLGGIFKRRRYDIRLTTSDDTALIGIMDDVTQVEGEAD